jgi:pyruvate/2-oxoglutarate dehydrogenase complex dihydrolipoamide dehydrogenase (E3) component
LAKCKRACASYAENSDIRYIANSLRSGVGVGPQTTFLKENKAVNLEKDGSLKTDEHFAVEGLKDVYAVGDIATYP